ncbi:response regulator [Melittangium boletus]|uniref:Two-component system response regulator n=1 Tax=Melittangium boletus DSM 14713 TaxID=1294270 RepID=A0A250IIF1_9BACT|nr:response regulator [Melittangium boletus]ATB31599.1 two-component system response regulator [Melittangium boletus DSM 14713]
MNHALPILVVEDNDEDFDMLQMTFQWASIPNPLYRCAEGEEALEFLGQTGRYASTGAAPRPGLILLDLNLAGLDGRQVLEHVKNDRHLKSIPVLVFSTSDNPKDVQSAYAHGASGYLLKPVDLPRFERMIRLFKEFWLDHIVMPEDDGREVARG